MLLIMCSTVRDSFPRLAIIGVTEQYLNQKVERDKYMEDVTQLQSHVSRLNHRFVIHFNLQILHECLNFFHDYSKETYAEYFLTTVFMY